MGFPSVTNVDGSNPGPNSSTSPDTTQSSIGNVWKVGSFDLAITPASVAAATTAEQIFPMTGLLTTDFVSVNKPSAQAGLGIAGVRVSSAGNIGITYVNPTSAAITPTAETYVVHVVRVQPNWTAPPSGSLMDW